MADPLPTILLSDSYAFWRIGTLLDEELLEGIWLLPSLPILEVREKENRAENI